MERELKKTKEVRDMLENASASDRDTQKRLMSNSKELDSIVDLLDADQKTCDEHGKYRDLWFMQRQQKVSVSINELITQIASRDFG